MRGALVPIAALALLIVLLLALTRIGAHALRADAVEADLGILPSPSERARALDDAVLDGLERGAFDAELRHRLGRASRTVALKPFMIDICEVKQSDYERFAEWLRKPRKGGKTLTPKAAEALRSASTGHRIAGMLRSAATGVTYAGAEAYCRAAGGRLPWAEEREAAAGGKEGRLYPWGDFFSGESWPFEDAWRNAAQPCGLHSASDTPQGVHDLAGNALEWSRGSRSGPPQGRLPAAHGAPAVRSQARSLYALSSSWIEIPPETRSHHLGFRCVYDRHPPAKLPWGAGPAAVRIPGGRYPLGLPPDARLARIAALLPEGQAREARKLFADPQQGARRIRAERCEVSRRDYALFLNDPLVRLGLFANEREPENETYLPLDWESQLREQDRPVGGMSWWAADAFARWAGGRLPGVGEWQLLAAGPEGRVYPWGDAYDAQAALTGDRPASGPASCGDSPRDVSAAGLQDLAGNVSEWTRSVAVDRGDYAIWVQGGNWILPGEMTARSLFGRLVPLGHRSPAIGFRIVYD